MINTKNYIVGKFFIFLLVNVSKPFRKGLEPMDLNLSVEGMFAENPFLKVRIPLKYLKRRVEMDS